MLWEAEINHWPHSAGLEEQKKTMCDMGKDYPHTIVDHGLQREKVLNLFKTV